MISQEQHPPDIFEDARHSERDDIIAYLARNLIRLRVSTDQGILLFSSSRFRLTFLPITRGGLTSEAVAYASQLCPERLKPTKTYSRHHDLYRMPN